MEYIDLTYDISEETPYWVEHLPFKREVLHKGLTDGGFWLECYAFSMPEHCGTHIDAPIHFAEGRWTVDQIPLSHLMGPGIVIDIQEKVDQNPNILLSAEDINKWLDEHGAFPDGVIIFIRSGWASRYGSQKDWFGVDSNDTSKPTFPGIGKDAAELIVSYEKKNGTKIVGIGLDSPSLDNGLCTDFISHRTLLGHDIYGLENVANLDKLPAKGFNVVVMPLKLRGGSGGPTRIVASLPRK